LAKWKPGSPLGPTAAAAAARRHKAVVSLSMSSVCNAGRENEPKAKRGLLSLLKTVKSDSCRSAILQIGLLVSALAG
jgi:hypothetical protein